MCPPRVSIGAGLVPVAMLLKALLEQAGDPCGCGHGVWSRGHGTGDEGRW